MARHIRDLEGISPFQIPEHIHESVKQCRGGYLLVPVKWESETVTRSYSVKKVFLKISPNSQEDTCARVSFLIKFQAEVCNFIKKETLAQVFSLNF